MPDKNLIRPLTQTEAWEDAYYHSAAEAAGEDISNPALINWEPYRKQLEDIKVIAKGLLDIETLETRQADSLDFHEVSVWGVRAALSIAYEAGKQSKK